MVLIDMNIPLVFIRDIKDNFIVEISLIVHFYIQKYHKNEIIIKIKTLVLFI